MIFLLQAESIEGLTGVFLLQAGLIDFLAGIHHSSTPPLEGAQEGGVAELGRGDIAGFLGHHHGE